LGQYEDYQSAAIEAIRTLHISRRCKDDAMQEAAVAFYSGESVVKHLRKWWNKELAASHKVIAFGNATRSSDDFAEIKKIQADYR